MKRKKQKRGEPGGPVTRARKPGIGASQQRAEHGARDHKRRDPSPPTPVSAQCPKCRGILALAAPGTPSARCPCVNPDAPPLPLRRDLPARFHEPTISEPIRVRRASTPRPAPVVREAAKDWRAAAIVLMDEARWDGTKKAIYDAQSADSEHVAERVLTELTRLSNLQGTTKTTRPAQDFIRSRRGKRGRPVDDTWSFFLASVGYTHELLVAVSKEAAKWRDRVLRWHGNKPRAALRRRERRAALLRVVVAERSAMYARYGVPGALLTRPSLFRITPGDRELVDRVIELHDDPDLDRMPGHRRLALKCLNELQWVKDHAPRGLNEADVESARKEFRQRYRLVQVERQRRRSSPTPHEY